MTRRSSARRWTERRVGLALLLTLGLVAGACSSGRDAEDSGSTGTTEATAASDSFGDLASPCGPAEGTNTDTGEQGVTADSISIGYGDDAGYAAADLGSALSDAVDAMVGWCNEQGGINGRRIDATYYDAAITEVNNAWLAACPKEFFMVGQGYSLDASQETIRRECGLPSVPAYSVSPQFSNAPLMYQPLPNPVQYVNNGPAYQLAELFPEQVKKAAVVYANYPATIDTWEKTLSAYPAAGWTFLECDQQYNIQGEADWKPIAQKLKDCGAEAVYFIGAPSPNFQNLLEASAQLDFDPVWTAESVVYDQSFAAWNQAGYGDKLYFRLSLIPFEEAADNKATQDFLDITGSSDNPSPLAAQGASAFLLWATAAKACGADLTRQCVLDELSKIDAWNGGGIQGEADPAQNLPTDCAILMQMKGNEFVRVTPPGAAEYDCSPEYRAEVTGAVVDRANLDADGISQP